MLVTTTEQIAGKSYEILGLAQGSTIQCKNVGRDITQGLKQLVGGELSSPCAIRPPPLCRAPLRCWRMAQR